MLLVAGNAGQVITGNHNNYIICADSAELADNWVAAIRRVMVEVGSVAESAVIYLSLAIWWRDVWPQSRGDNGSGGETGGSVCSPATP